MLENPLLVAGANAVIAGGGAIGTAFANQLVARPGVARPGAARPGAARPESGRVIMLARREPQGLDARVEVVPLEATDPGSVATAADACSHLGRVHLLINTVGLLHATGVQPEKRLKDIQPKAFQHAMAVNALFPALLAEAFSKALRHDQAAMLASLSARVGSITDNGLGGWYSYRASKAAHNMLLRTLSREWRVSHRNVTVVALHPGTVDSALSRPYVGASYGKRVLSPDEAATHLLQVMRDLTPADSGSFFDWRGEPVPW